MLHKIDQEFEIQCIPYVYKQSGLISIKIGQLLHILGHNARGQINAQTFS